MTKWILTAFLLLAPSLALAQNQGQIVPSGRFTTGHTIRCQNSTCTVAVDGGGSAGSNLNGQGYLTEIGITNTGTPFCINDALINAAGGYHQLCLGANALGGGLISYNAVGGASPLDFTINLNGTNYPFPGPGSGNVLGPNASILTDLACWNNTGGTLLFDCAASLPTTSGLSIARSSFTNPIGGVNAGLRINMSNLGGLSGGNPGANGAVAASLFTDNTGGRTEIAALNTVCVQQPIGAGGGFGINHCVELDVAQSLAANVPTDPFSPGPVSHALELVASSNTSTSPQNPQAAVWIWGQDDGNVTDFAYGVAAARVKYGGFTCAPFGNSDTGSYFQTACYMDTSNSTRVMSIGGTHTIFFDLSATTTLGGTFIKGLPGADSNLNITSASDHSMGIDIDSGVTVSQASYISLSDKSSAIWQITKNSGNDFGLTNEGTGVVDIFVSHSADTVILNKLVSTPGAGAAANYVCTDATGKIVVQAGAC